MVANVKSYDRDRNFSRKEKKERKMRAGYLMMRSPQSGMPS